MEIFHIMGVIFVFFGNIAFFANISPMPKQTLLMKKE